MKQSLHSESGQPLKEFLQEIGVSYATYHYWSRKTKTSAVGMPIAPIAIIDEKFTASAGGEADRMLDIRDIEGVMVAFLNGLRAHFGWGSEEMLMELFTKSLPDHVLPQ